MDFPEKYETNKSVAARDAALFVPKIIDFLGPWSRKENVLDYGCGAGSTAYKYILPQVIASDSNLYSVDISHSMLDFAINNYPHPKISYAQGDIVKHFPFTNVKFDKIFSIYVFHSIRDMSVPFKNFLDILKPGGRLGFTLIPKNSYHAIMDKLGASEMWKEYLHGYEETFCEWINYEDGKGHETCQAILQQAGFNVIHLEVMKLSYFFENMETVLDLYMSVTPKMGSVPRELHPQFKEDFRKLLTEDAGIPLHSQQYTMYYDVVLAVIEKPNRLD